MKFVTVRPFFESNNEAGSGGASGDANPPTPTPAAAQPPAPKKFEKFEDFISSQPADVQELFTGHIGGLKSALEKERKRTGSNLTPEDIQLLEKYKAIAGTDDDPAVQLDKEKLRTTNLERQLQQRVNEYREVLKEKQFDDSMIELDYWFVNEAAQNDAVMLLEKYDLGENFEKMGEALKQMAADRPHLFLTPKKQGEEDTEKKSANTKRREELKSKTQREAEIKKRFRIK